MVENVPPLTGWIPRRTPRAAIGWWFVPLANFWIPFTIAREALRRLDPGSRSWAARLVPAWWGLYLAGSFVSGASSSLGRMVSTIDEIRTALVLSLASVAMLAIAGSCLVIVVWSTEQIGRRRAAALGIGASGTPEWPEIAYALAGQPAATVPTASWPEAAAPVTSVASADGPAEPPPPPA
jgi:hypothetical protein